MTLEERIAAQRAEGERIMAEAAEIQRQVDAYVQQAQTRLAELQQAFHRTEGAINILVSLQAETEMALATARFEPVSNPARICDCTVNEAACRCGIRTRMCASFQGKPCDCDDDEEDGLAVWPEALEGFAR